MGQQSVASFWGGRPLSYFEQVCLKSFVDHGFEVRLFSYEPDLNLPDGVIREDARQILPDPAVTEAYAGMAPFADRFRIEMMYQTGLTWVDCDMACLGPLPDEAYLFARENRHVGNAVLRLPAGCETLLALRALLNAPEPWLPADWLWMRGIDDALIDRREENRLYLIPGAARKLPYMSFGPHALHYFLRRFGAIAEQQPSHVFYPLPATLLRRNFETPRQEPIRLSDETCTIHHIGGRPFYRELRRRGNRPLPHPDSLIGQLCARHGIDPEKAPRLFD